MLYAKTIDVREYNPVDKKRIIFESFDSLGKGEKMELINDHDPKPLYNQFKEEKEGFFNWEYTQEGPEIWKIEITKNFANE